MNNLSDSQNINQKVFELSYYNCVLDRLQLAELDASVGAEKVQELEGESGESLHKRRLVLHANDCRESNCFLKWELHAASLELVVISLTTKKYRERDATGERSNLPCQDVRCITTAHILPSVTTKYKNRVKQGAFKGRFPYSYGNDGSSKVHSGCNIGLDWDRSGAGALTAG